MTLPRPTAGGLVLGCGEHIKGSQNSSPSHHMEALMGRTRSSLCVHAVFIGVRFNSSVCGVYVCICVSVIASVVSRVTVGLIRANWSMESEWVFLVQQTG